VDDGTITADSLTLSAFFPVAKKSDEALGPPGKKREQSIPQAVRPSVML